MTLKFLHKYAQKLQSAETEEQIEEVKKQLEQFLPAQTGKTKPMSQDNATSLPPVQKPFDPTPGKRKNPKDFPD